MGGWRFAAIVLALAAVLILLGVALLLATNKEILGFLSFALGLVLFIVALSLAPAEKGTEGHDIRE